MEEAQFVDRNGVLVKVALDIEERKRAAEEGEELQRAEAIAARLGCKV